MIFQHSGAPRARGRSARPGWACCAVPAPPLAGCQGEGSERTGTSLSALGSLQSGPGNACSAARVALSGGNDDPGNALEYPPDPCWTADDDHIIAPIWRGDVNKGQLYTPLWRGALPGIEEVVFTPDDHDCRDRKFTVRVDWDSVANTVSFLTKGHNIVPYPTVYREAGTQWQYNPFHSVMCWGLNNGGQLGTGPSDINAYEPMAIAL